MLTIWYPFAEMFPALRRWGSAPESYVVYPPEPTPAAKRTRKSAAKATKAAKAKPRQATTPQKAKR